MEQISKVRKCFHCGATLQSEDPTKEGYVKAEVLENPTQNFIFCDRCFEAERFHSVSNEPFIEEDFIHVLQEAKENGCLLVYVVNLFSFETSFSKEVIDLVQGMKILVVGTKFDLLPKDTSKEDIQEYVAHRFRVAGLKIACSDVMITSSYDSESSQEILTRIFEVKDAKSVYVIGSSDAGKTALISSFLKIYSNLSKGNIVTHEYEGTNLRVLEIPLTKKSSMYETPGISNTNSFLFGLDKQTIKSIYLTKPVEAREITLFKGQSLFIGGLAVVELLEGDRSEIKCYFHKNVELRKTHVSSVEDKFERLVKKHEISPCMSRVKSTKDMDVFDIETKNGGGHFRDIGFTGLGWISFRAKNQKFRVYVPKGVSIYTSRPKARNK